MNSYKITWMDRDFINQAKYRISYLHAITLQASIEEAGCEVVVEPIFIPLDPIKLIEFLNNQRAY